MVDEGSFSQHKLVRRMKPKSKIDQVIKNMLLFVSIGISLKSSDDYRAASRYSTRKAMGRVSSSLTAQK